MVTSLEGRVVLLTGVTSGIGREVARRLVGRGAVVVGAARTESRLAAVARELPGVEVQQADVTSRAERAALVEHVLAAHGRVDVLVNDAGVGRVGFVHELSADDVDVLFATNAVAVTDLTRLVLPDMLGRGDGDVVMVSSIGAWLSTPPLTAYCSTKHAVNGLVKGLRREVGRRGVRVHEICPAPVATEFLSRAGDYQPDEHDPVALPRGDDGVGDPAGWHPGRVDQVIGVSAAPVVRLGRRMVERRTP